MINAARTLLLNQSSANSPGANYPGEEFVPPFQPIPLPIYLTAPLQTIFGIAPDRAMRNYRLRELMSILHTSELAPYVYALDPRVTYWPPNNDSLFQAILQGIQATQLAGSPATINVLGQTGIITDGDILNYVYQITVTSSTQVLVTQVAGGSNSTTYTYSTSGGLSSPVPLTGSGITFTFQPVVGAVWQVSWVATPARDLAAIDLNLRYVISGNLKTQLFGANPSEPYLTFLNLWNDNILMPYRMGGLVLALVYQLNALRGG